MGFKPHIRYALTITALMLVVLFKFQNCAPQADLASNTSPVSQRDSEVRAMERMSNANLSFAVSLQVVPTNNEGVQVLGRCATSENHQSVVYQVFAFSTEPYLVSSGETECIAGAFELRLEPIYFQSCEEKIQIQAAHPGEGWSKVETFLIPDCS